MVKSHVRASPEFIKIRDVFKQNLEPQFGRRISDTELTRDIALFLDREQLIPIMVRRACQKQKRESRMRHRRGGLFG